MHLTGDHKIHLPRLHGIGHEIDGMRAPAPGKKHQVIERMPVRGMQLLVMFIQISGKPADEQPPSSALIVNSMDIINGKSLRHALNIFRFVQFGADPFLYL